MTTQTNKKAPHYDGFFTRSVPVSLNESERTIQAVVATEDPVMVMDYQRWEPIMEVLLMSGAVVPENRQVPLLDDHSRYGTGSIRGSARDITIDGSRMMATVHFAETEDGDEVLALARGGDLTDLSAGYQVYASKSFVIQPGESTTIDGRAFKNDYDMPMVIRTKWKIKEASLTPIGADENSKFRSLPGNADTLATLGKVVENLNEINRKLQPHTEDRTMPEKIIEQQTAAPAPAPVVPTVDESKIRSEAIAAERSRVTEITDSCRSMNLSDEFASKLINDNVSIDNARKAIIEETRKSLESIRKTVVTKDQSENTREGATNALLMRAGYKLDEKTADSVRKSEFNGATPLGVARIVLARAGKTNVLSMDNVGVTNAILDHSRGFAQGTGDFPYILATSANKFLQRGFVEANTTYQRWVERGTFNDFKTNDLVNISPFSNVEEIKEGQPFNFGKFNSKKETAQLAIYGGAWSIPFQAIVNDDLNAFTRAPGAMGNSINRKIDANVYDLLYGSAGTGPTMAEDSGVMFQSGATRYNLGTSAAPTVTSLGEARMLLRKIKALAPEAGQSIYTGANLRYVICCVEKELAFEQLLISANDPFLESATKNANAVNPFYRNFELIATPLLSAKSSTVWYAAASPTEAQHIAVYNLAGYETPTIRSESGRVSEALGITMDVSFAFVAGAPDWRGIVKNAGA